MALDERARNQMHNRFREVLGDDVADTVMDSLSPTGWQDLATTKDLAASMELLEHKLTANFERAMRSQSRWFFLTNAGLVVALATFFSTVR